MEGIIFTVQKQQSGVFLVCLLFLLLTYKTNDSIWVWKIQTGDKINDLDVVFIQGLYVMRKNNLVGKNIFI